MPEVSREEAREIIDKVRRENGGITEETRRRAETDLLRSYDNLLVIAGGSTLLLAAELYSKNTRFVFELIQNAEDNRYTHAAARSEAPFLKFTLSHDRIIVDSNEDGFTESNVRAICTVGQSTKRPGGGYVGHKGIGFKSVFKIAYWVKIQSEPFSFFFTHRQGQSGMGMITPDNTDYEALPDGVRTRITLYLLEPDQFGELESEFSQIPDTLMLFLSKLERISVRVIPQVGQASTTTYERRGNQPNSSLRLMKTIDNRVEESFYYTEKTTLSDLPERSSRDSRREAEIILAFPTDANLNPVAMPQYVYSFLPLRQEGFRFLIQSDFITQANREGILDCTWNRAIRDGVADVFVNAVHQFCSRPSLQHKWLAYLPSPYVADPFWSRLRETIVTRLKGHPVIFTRGGGLRCPGDVQRLSARHCDQHDQPLFDDLSPEIYLSSLYSWSVHSEHLMSLGVTNISYPNLLARLDPYLRGSRPRILGLTFGSAINEDWHTRVANLLIRAMKQGTHAFAVKGRIIQMPLIPLLDGSLSSNERNDIHFPDDCEGNTIPVDLRLRMVKRSALQNRARKSLFEMLGVDHYDPLPVIRQILTRYNRASGITLNNSISHLRYLYLTHERAVSIDDRIFLLDQQETPIYHKYVTFGEELVVDDLYFETPGEYGTSELAERIRSAAREQGTESYKMHFIHESYLGAVSSDFSRNGRSWEKWLEDMAHVRRIPKLKASGRSNVLSMIFLDVIDFRPDMLIGLLKTYWDSYESEITPEIVDLIENAEVPCHATENRFPLKSIYFPSAELRGICSQAGISDRFTFFLVIPSSWTTDTSAGWEFLCKFGVRTQPDLKFFEDIFYVLTEEWNPSLVQRAFFTIYEELFTRFRAEQPAGIKDMFNKYPSVCIPADGARRARTFSLDSCVWNGIRCLRTRNPLAIYEEYSHNPSVKFLFRNILGVGNASRSTYINELKYRKRGANVSCENLRAIYEEFVNVVQSEDAWTYVREKFEEHSLIYVPSEGSWYPPTSCVWAGAARIGGKYGISTPYAGLEHFFVERLSIQPPNTSTYVAQLQILCANHTLDIGAIKTAIDNISQLNPTNADLDSIRELRCLPVRTTNGRISLTRPVGQFFIVDRIEYGNAFQGRVPVLDFELEDVRRLHPFLTALGLADRYMSSAVEETTTVQMPSSQPSASLTHAFRQKAKYFYRCAVHYDADRIQDNRERVYQTFRNAVLYESDGFTKTLTLSQGDLTVTAPSNRGLLHVEEDNGALQLFVPRDPEQLECCYSGELGDALIRYLGINDPAAIGSFRTVILGSATAVQYTLDGDGIVRPSIPDIPNLQPSSPGTPVPGQPVSDDSTFTPVSSETQTSTTTRRQQRATRHTDAAVVTHSLSGANSEPRLARVHSEEALPEYEFPSSLTPANDERLAFPSTSRPRPENAVPPTLDTQYVRLLGRVLEAARRAVFPSVESLNLQGLANSLPSTSTNNTVQGSPFGIRSDNQIEHDIKIGAAGELYTFELLLRLGLPGFDRSNWQSNIRNRVNVHPEYHDLAPWSGSETADIIYNDASSTLTRLLVSNGYLPGPGWGEASPKYLMEVKSTTGSCETAFYMSKSQYRRMQLLRLTDPPSANMEIYIIFRVFNLGRENMGVRIYLDPETLRLEERLQFTPESYSITPASPLL